MTVVTLAFAVLFLPGAPALAQAYSMVALIETQSRGQLDCGNRVRGQEKTQVLLGITDELGVADADVASGQVGAMAYARPLVIRKDLDRCSPPLFTALVNREPITRVEIRLFDGQGIHFFTIVLENAAVTRIARVVRGHGLHEEVAFAYRTLRLIDERTGVSASHDLGG
jgi:type VI secretion system secreted protein Hcp